MLLILAAAGLCLMSAAVLRGVFPAQGRLEFVGFDGPGVLAGFVATTCAALAFGPLNGLALVGALIWHEAGHTFAARMIGTGAAEFRFLPKLLGLRTRRMSLGRDVEIAFHALMGSGLSIAPMIASLALALAISDAAPAITGFFRALAISFGVLNAIALLPFAPFDGGRCLGLVSRSLSPSLFYLAGATAVGALAVAAPVTGQVWPAAIAALGLSSLVLQGPKKPVATPLTAREAALALLAWAATLATHAWGAWLLVFGGL